jgi:Asp-tRNA(Asn)/Glu-tRNA(Gln) amidotransferase C subunit
MDIKKPLGTFATSIFEFADQLKKVDLKSLEFHNQRNDFAKWLREVIRDDWLAAEFEKLQTLKLSGERLRAKAVEVTDKRCKELAAALKSLSR